MSPIELSSPSKAHFREIGTDALFSSNAAIEIPRIKARTLPGQLWKALAAIQLERTT